MIRYFSRRRLPTLLNVAVYVHLNRDENGASRRSRRRRGRHIAYGFDDHDKRAYPELAATNERINERTSENVRVLSVRRLLLVDE